jgi:Zn-finger nucleic acid-binding protein
VDPSDEREVLCPKCGRAMRSVYIEAMQIHRCTQCGGLWMRATDKDRLLASHRAVEAVDRGSVETGRTMDRMTHITCPEDHSPMIHQVDPQQPHIGYESCSVCGGVFLDAGELKDLEDLTLLERLRSMFG